MRAPPRERAPPAAEGARRTVVVRAPPTRTRAPLVPALERRAVVVRAAPTRAPVPLVPALERRAVVVHSLPSQVREKPVAALEALERRAVMMQAAPTTQVRVQPVAVLERGALVVEAAPTQVRVQPVAVLERGELAIRGPSGLSRVRWGIWNRPLASRPLMSEALQWRQSASFCASSWPPARQSPSQSTRRFATTCARMCFRSEVSCWSRMLIELLFLRHLNLCRHFFYCCTVLRRVPCSLFSGLASHATFGKRCLNRCDGVILPFSFQILFSMAAAQGWAAAAAAFVALARRRPHERPTAEEA